ncbi:MAG TPA: winged helix-turn-helix domain-containing protein, partial [Thermoanaerobaculia bacterium]|nr:winged helix-turn-helix domain-containing protein [Thermoanaerobaculia bacterium]
MSLPGASATDLRQGFRLGDDRTVLPRENRIAGPQGEAHLEPRTMDVLVCLVGHAGEVVSRETLNEVVWEGAIVTDHALTNCISELRQSLGDTPAEPRFIATVPKRGYRLIAPVAPLDPERSAASQAGVGTARRRRVAGIVAAALLLAAVTGFGWWLLRSAETAAARSSPSTVAVLPFRNLAGDEELAYLRLALPDEITTALTRASGLAVRPFEPTAAAEPAAAGRAVRASTVVTG